MPDISIIGSGWLAEPLSIQLNKEGHDVLLTTTRHDKLRLLQDKGLSVIQYSLGDQLSSAGQLFNTGVMIIAITSKDVDAFAVLLDQLKGYPALHLIFISSTSVYKNNGLVHDETSQQLNLENPLVKIEQLIEQHPSATIIRFAGLIGPKRHPGRFFDQGRPLKNPLAPVNLIHLDDCIGLIKTVINNNAWNELFNGCADTHPTKAEFYTMMAKQLGIENLDTTTDTNSSFKTINNDKIKTVLSYKLLYPDLMTIKI